VARPVAPDDAEQNQIFELDVSKATAQAFPNQVRGKFIPWKLCRLFPWLVYIIPNCCFRDTLFLALQHVPVNSLN
jgi:hypothetical protein